MMLIVALHQNKTNDWPVSPGMRPELEANDEQCELPGHSMTMSEHIWQMWCGCQGFVFTATAHN